MALKLLKGLPAEVRDSSKTIHLLADSGFSSKDFIKGVIALNFAGFIGMRGDRKTSTGQKLREITTPGRKIQLYDLPGVDLWVSWVWFTAKKGDAQEQRLRSGVVNRVRSRRFIVSTVSRMGRAIKGTGRLHWKIEALFKTLKSRFGLGKFGQYSKLGVLRHGCLSLLSYSEWLDRPNTGYPTWPNWGALAQQVRRKFST
ncbi:transposase [Deinococcus detaillensis]|uniref:Transposase n=1 Tax=Deinococcus detaillensis TaxID=2592048 RepID=A0A553UMM5_9DEIO|nr:transposase [Deinococcus detaillensis]TSA81457.1 transposase [Deinococcus detaillensis]